ncbi:hypothetical protein [Novosphingobium sp. AP12]|uniref:hypothetical protein n=1 Tax=Novosphingobium sp. AP12 TaxID=1144305 RepID=UPI00027205E7|nr:hypothetical protein [Novosphingobium sp. AP12]EJL23971.1 hypothetical protein PMI02_03891 [Novosphingobium sp. AP12]
MADLIELQGGDGVPPEPNWRTIFGGADDRKAAAEYTTKRVGGGVKNPTAMRALRIAAA